MRRCQQFELYAAEANVDHGRRFDSTEEIERWVNSFRDEWWWDRFYRGVDVIEVTDSQFKDGSVGGFDEQDRAAVLNMKSVHFNEHDVLHELAHPLSKVRFGSSSHDPFFARVLLELTFLVRGHESWQELLAAFHAGGIEVDETDDAEAHRRKMLGE